MGNKPHSNKGYNAALREKEAEAVRKQDRKVSVVMIVAIALLIAAVVCVVLVIGLMTHTSSEVSMDSVKAEINSMKADQFTETDKKTEYVKISVRDYGDIIVRLRKDVAPITVKNFQKLVDKKFYDNLTFHRVMKGFMIQGGDPKGDGTGHSDPTIKGEFSANGVGNNLKHVKGVISMARTQDMDSASCQFFICHGDASHLDGQYASFGYVVAGLDVVDAIANAPVQASTSGESSKPAKPIVIESIRFVKAK